MKYMKINMTHKVLTRRKEYSMITEKDMKSWVENYDEAIQTLMWIVNDNYTKDDMIESITDFKKEIKDE